MGWCLYAESQSVAVRVGVGAKNKHNEAAK